jgi:hypothetical protein
LLAIYFEEQISTSGSNQLIVQNDSDHDSLETMNDILNDMLPDNLSSDEHYFNNDFKENTNIQKKIHKFLLN